MGANFNYVNGESKFLSQLELVKDSFLDIFHSHQLQGIEINFFHNFCCKNKNNLHSLEFIW
jgi:hypothetical protein